MRHDDPPVSDLRRNPWQHRCDVFVGQAMKAVALHASRAEVARQRDHFGDSRLPAMEAGVEAGHLGDIRQQLRNRLDGADVVGLMKRRERDKIAQILQNFRCHERWSGVPRAAVHDAMPDADDRRTSVPRSQPGREKIQRRAPIADRRLECALVERRPVSVLHRESRSGADPVNLAARREPPRAVLRALVDTELQARRAGVEDEGICIHVVGHALSVFS